MKKTIIFKLLTVVILLGLFSCEENKITYDGPWFVHFSQSSYSFSIAEEIAIPVFLTAPLQSNDVTATLSISTDLVEGVDYTINKKELTFKAGTLSDTVIITGLDTKILNNSTIVLGFESTSGDFATSNSEQSVAVVKAIPVVKEFLIDDWVGSYTYYGDGWSRDWAELKKVPDETHQVILYGFWGSVEELVATVDDSDWTNITLSVPAGTLLDVGWDAEGQWWLSEDLIGKLDLTTKTITFTQFSYITDAGTEGTFPWCSGTCTMIKN